MSEATVTPAIKDLGDKIVALSLLQAKELSDYLKNNYGLEAAAASVAMAPAAGAGAGAAAPEKTEFDIVLDNSGASPTLIMSREDFDRLEIAAQTNFETRFLKGKDL